MVYSHAHSFIFVHVPRTGGTSITRALSSIVPDARTDWRITHHTVASIRQTLGCDYPAFGFARNPFSRAVSFYGWSVRSKLGRLPTAEVREEFHGFLQRLSQKNWRPAWDYLATDGQFDRIFIGRFETLQDDFDAACGCFGIEPTKLPHEHNSNRLSHYSEYFDDRSRSLVMKMSRLDFDGFGYSTCPADGL